ncbi:MAG: endonuclease I [Urechidicola sp.]|jgi:endonuclease I
MKKRYFIISFLLINSFGFAQEAYYDDIIDDLNDLQGIALKEVLATKITNTHLNTLSYNDARECLKIVDLEPGQIDNVLLLYGFSNTMCPASPSDGDDHRLRDKDSFGGGTSCEWNREHVYAQSEGTPPLGQSGPGADAHHLRATDVDRNGQRGSLHFINGSGNSGSTNAGWYPGEEWKGDVARIIMYMYLRYGNQCLPSGITIGNSNSVDSNMIDLLLEWNAADNVSNYEDNRNTYLENTGNTYGQGNRNPFIDNPYLATLIWGGTPAVDRWNIFINDTEAPTAPTNLTASNETSSSVDLNWTVSTDNVGIAGYDIYVDNVFNSFSNTNSYTVSELSAFTTYSFTILAKDFANIESDQSVALNGTTLAADIEVPTVPLNLSASNETGSSIDLDWDVSTDNLGVTGYDIYVNNIFNSSSDTNSHSVTGLSASTTYSFSVLAKDLANNESAQSVAVNATTTVGGTSGSNCVTETFENTPVNPNSYGTYNWIGDDNFQWEATDSRTDQMITTRTITIRNGNLRTTQPVSDGIGELTVTTQLVFTGSSGTFDLKVNGVSRGSIPYNSNVQTTTIQNINIEGSVTILIDTNSTGTNRVQFDDLTWTCYSAPLAIEGFKLSDVKLFPNPSNGNTITVSSIENLQLTFFDILGKKVLESTSTTTNKTVDVSKLRTGVYFVKLENETGSTTKKFIKK